MLGGMLILKDLQRAVRLLQTRCILISLALASLAAACAAPITIYVGTPTLGPNALATVIAGTAAAAAAQTQAAVPTQAAAPTATVTSVPLFSTEGTALIRHEDGSSTFIDRAGGYELKVPAGWLLVRVDEGDLLTARALPEAVDPKIQHFLDQAQNNDAELFRLFGADTRPEHLQGSFVSNFNVLWDRNSTGSLEQMIGILKAELPGTFLDPEITFSDVLITSSRIPVGVVESNSTLLTAAGWPVYLYQKQVIYRLNPGTLTIVLSTTMEEKNTYLPAFDAMVDQIVLLEQ